MKPERGRVALLTRVCRARYGAALLEREMPWRRHCASSNGLTAARVATREVI